MTRHRTRWSQGTTYIRTDPELIKQVMEVRERLQISARYAVASFPRKSGESQ